MCRAGNFHVLKEILKLKTFEILNFKWKILKEMLIDRKISFFTTIV